MHRVSRWSLVVGMPNMVTDSLSEVELLKHVAEFQWRQIGETIGCPTQLLANEAGDRLYASVINFETNFSPSDISQFEEGDTIELTGTIRFYARQFVEGWILLDKGPPVSEETFRAIRSKQDLDATSRPWIYMTNALVGREDGNLRLKTYRPAGIEKLDVPQTSEKPTGIVEHEQALQAGLIDVGQFTPVNVTESTPFVYEITPVNDLNGAGLLYFARYVAMMNYAERLLLLRRTRPPLSSQLTHFLRTESRRTYYFANAPATDRVQIYCTPAFEIERAFDSTDPLRTRFGSFVFRFELYRESDGALMAISMVRKALTIPNKIKSVQAEARRFIRSLGA